eukprot:66053-Pyramimonas_sp.AAC.1
MLGPPGAASTASTTPTRQIGALVAEQGTIQPKCSFALSVERARPRARSVEARSSRQITSGDGARVAGVRRVKGVTVDSGAQIT